ncbi:MAG: DUF2796 domain-containing protein [Aestuariibacter sp.]
MRLQLLLLSQELSAMNKRYLQVKMLLLWVLSFHVSAQQHVHGHGQLLIAQEQQKWHLKFILPAADILGFEHKPETEEQKHLLKEVTKRFESADEVVELKGSCRLDRVKNVLPQQEDDNKAHSDREEDDHHHHSRHEQENKHSDIEVEYFFICESKVTAISVKLFDWARTLQHIKTQWIRDNGQGVAELNGNQPFIEWL